MIDEKQMYGAPRLRGKVGQVTEAEKGFEHLVGEWTFMILFSLVGLDDEVTEFQSPLTFKTEDEAYAAMKVQTKEMSELVCKTLGADPSQYYDFKSKQVRPWMEH